MAYRIFKDLARRTASGKFLRDKVFNIAKNPKYDRHQRGLASMVYKFFDKRSAGSGVANNEIKQNLQLAEGLHKPIIRNFKKRTVYSQFKDNVCCDDLADMQLIDKFNKRFRFLLCVIDKFRIEKLIKKKGDKLYVKWKGYDSSSNSWIDKKRLN